VTGRARFLPIEEWRLTAGHVLPGPDERLARALEDVLVERYGAERLTPRRWSRAPATT
jgi:hypothetical protein